MNSVDFHKMSGSGNDFIIIDNRNQACEPDNLSEFIVQICRRKMSVGADGLILIETSTTADFKWQFFNSDGSRAEMCGNGARCAARFALLTGITASNMSFETDAGIVHAEVKGDRVKVKMPEPSELRLDVPIALERSDLSVCSLNTGVPHVVVLMDEIESADVVSPGAEIRYHPDFAPAGTNVNFICPKGDDTIAIRTYERGVEDETLACGTGSIAGALVAAQKFGMTSPVRVHVRSGELLGIYFTQSGSEFSEVYLEGDARVIYAGKLNEDAWK